jgi:hypothetical protein
MQRISLFVLFLFTSISISAAPALQSTQIAVANQADGAKVVAALGAWMEGYGSKSSSRVVVHAHVADGSNPATHTILAISPSVAAMEAFNQQVTDSEEGMAEWQAFLSKVQPISKVTTTGRTSLIKSWGKIDDDDTVWLVHAMSTNDGASVVRAMDAWMASPTGKKFPGEAHLMGTVAGSPATHLMALGYESQTEMEEWGAVAGPSGDLARLMNSIRVLTEYHGASLSVTAAAFGKSAKSVLSQ